MGRIAIVGPQDGLGGRVRAALEPSGHAVDLARSVHERPSGSDVVVVATTATAAIREAVEATADDRGHLVLATVDPATVAWIHDVADGRFRREGRRMVVAAGLPGDLVGAVASDALGGAGEVHVAYALLGAAGPALTLPASVRRRLVSSLHEPMVVLADGRRVEEATAEQRRLAWFPRPLGPRHVVGIPAPEPITLPGARRQLATVRTYLAMPTWQAELLQLAAASARWAPARGILERMAGLPPRGRPSAARWGCVAEARRGDDVARAWVYGRDLVGLVAAGLSSAAERVLDDAVPVGVLGTAQLGAPDELLDELSVRSDTRWAARRPERDA